MARCLCAWHKLYFGEEKILNENIETATGKDSHGICVDCKRKVEKELEELIAVSGIDKKQSITHKG